MSLYQRLQKHAEFQPDKTAIESEAGKLTYSQLHVLTDQCVRYFKSVGLEPGDRVAILALNHPDWFIAVFAAAQCGVVLVPLNWRLSIDELGYMIGDSSAKLLLHDQEFEETATALKSTSGNLSLCRFGSSEFPSEPAGDQESLNHNNSDVNDPLLIVYTSSATGRPKGAVLNQTALLCSAEMSRHMTDLTVNDHVLNVLPLFHVGGLNIQPLPALLFGATLVLQARFIPDDAVTALSEKQITLINSVPTLSLIHI